MAINFPSATSVGEVYTDANGNTYVCTVLGPPAQWVGSGSSTDLNATYLRKDASNDPVTGQLEITPATDTTGLVVTQPSGNTAAAMRITNEGSGDSLVIEDSANPDSSPTVIDSSGRLLVGTSTSLNVGGGAGAQIQVAGTTAHHLSASRWSNSAFAGAISLGKSRGASPGTYSIVQSGDDLGYVYFAGDDGVDLQSIAAMISCQVDGTPGANDMPGRLVFSTTADGASSPTERMRITSSGSVFLGNTTYSATTNMVGFGNLNSTDTQAQFLVANTEATDTTALALFNRQGSDGRIIQFRQANTTEGTISVSGTTVTYGGGHLARWSQLPNDEDPSNILKGTVMSNLDEMCEWGNEDNEQLNKTKISDVEGDKNVAGVFVATSFDEEGPMDFFVAMTGDMVIRIAAGTTVQRGDLLISAGDGTAKPQGDGYVQDKTIAKVTSTNVSCIYDDGSYCVPCVLMAC